MQFISFLSKCRLPGGGNKVEGLPGLLLSIIAVCWSLFQLYTAYYPLTAMYQRIVHVTFAMVLIFCIYQLRGKERPTSLSFHAVLFSAIAVGIGIYLAINYTARAETIGMITLNSDLILGAIFIVAVLDICRRTAGWSFVIVTICLLLYARFGEIIPGVFAHKDYDLDRIISGLFLTTEGIFGSLTGISATFIFIFILFGAFLRHCGAGDFFLDFTNSFLGKRRGGAAKVAVVASSLFGMISGSALANVAGIGQFTIPLMKKTGYKPHFAGAVEAVSSSGGQLMPPVMGGTAFIMMEILGYSYFAICKAAVIMAVLYYATLFVLVDLEAAKAGLKGLKAEEIPPRMKTLSEGWHYIVPIGILVYCLASGMSATRAALFGTIAVPIVSLFRKKGRMSLFQLFHALEDSAYTACSLVGIVVAMGIVVGMISLTGLGLSLSAILINLAGGNLIILLILAMLTSLLLGMGVPIICAYIVLAVLVCPAMVALGVAPLAAHFFVFYFSILSAITPPVAPAAYVAANIAEAPMMKTALSACKMAIGLLILPYVMVYDTGLLMQGSVFGIVSVTLRASFIIFAIVVALEGHFFGKLGVFERALLVVVSIVMVAPFVSVAVFGYIIIGGVLLRRVYMERRLAQNSRLSN